VSALVPEGSDAPTRAEVRQLEARIDSRFQAVNARFTMMDRRFTGMANRIDEAVPITRRLTERGASESKATDERCDGIDARIDRLQDQMAARATQAHRTLVLTLVAVSAVWAVTCVVVAWLT
jgi:CHASE3 domain sensor protein